MLISTTCSVTWVFKRKTEFLCFEPGNLRSGNDSLSHHSSSHFLGSFPSPRTQLSPSLILCLHWWQCHSIGRPLTSLEPCVLQCSSSPPNPLHVESILCWSPDTAAAITEQPFLFYNISDRTLSIQLYNYHPTQRSPALVQDLHISFHMIFCYHF